MANRIAGGALFTRLGSRPGAVLGIAAIGFDLLERCHRRRSADWVRFGLIVVRPDHRGRRLGGRG